MKRILMIAIESDRWGPARLPQPLSRAGAEVAVLCPAANPLCHSAFMARHYELDGLKSWRTFARTLGDVMADFEPDLVIPCDEPVVAMLHFLLKNSGMASRKIGDAGIRLLRRSIGHADKLDAMVFKEQTLRLTRSIGIRVPPTTSVRTADEAAHAASALGFPVFLKKSFSWAGLGTAECASEEDARSAFRVMHAATPEWKALARRMMGRDWYPAESAIEVQKAIAGEAVMYSVACLDGKVLAGFFGRRATRMASTGPSTVIEIRENAACRHAAEQMIEAMGASGFLAFDFMICKESGDAVLLECNPRPNQMCHLGNHLGIDLCKALVSALNGEDLAPGRGNGACIVPLFPQEWLRDESAALTYGRKLDIPEEDPDLMMFMLKQGLRRGQSVSRLLKTLKTQGLLFPDYTFG